MIKKYFVLGTYLFAAIMLSFFIYTYNCQAEDLPSTPPPVPGSIVDIPERPNGKLYHSPIPLTTQRFVAYGRLIPSRDGKNSPDLSDESKVVQIARDTRDKLLLIRDSRGFFALQVVVIQHSTISIAKEPQLPWDLILPEIETILSALEK